MVSAGGDFILPLIWFLIVLLTFLRIENSASSQLMDEDTKGPVLKLDLHRYVLAACAKAYVLVDFFPQRCRKDAVILLISLPERINVVVDCEDFTVGMFLLLTADLRNSCLNCLGNN